MRFHGKGRNGKRHLLTLAPCGSIRVSMKTCCCPYVSSRSDLKPAEHKKSSSGAAWIFCMEPNSFGVTRGEQPLVCNGDDRGQRPKQGGAVGAAACRMRVPPKAQSRRREPQPAVSRDSNVSGGNVFCKRRKTQSTRKRSAREAHLSGCIHRQLNNFNKK